VYKEKRRKKKEQRKKKKKLQIFNKQFTNGTLLYHLLHYTPKSHTSNPDAAQQPALQKSLSSMNYNKRVFSCYIKKK